MLQYMLIIVGTVIGGGFASGREIGTYFMSFGKDGYIGIFIFAVLFFILCSKISFTCRKRNLYTAEEYFEFLYGKKAGQAVMAFTAIFSFAVFCSMISASSWIGGFVFKGYENVIRVLMVMFYFYMLSGGFGGVKDVNLVLSPILIIGICAVGIYALLGGESSYSVEENSAIKSFFSSAVYTCYNMITVVPAVIHLSKGKNTFLGNILSSAVLFLCAVLIASIIGINFNDKMLYSVPVMKYAVEEGGILTYLIFIVLFFSMVTTGIGAGCWALEYKNIGVKKKRVFLVCLVAFFISFTDFSVFVDNMYFVFGIAAMFQMIFVLFRI